jgi:thymidylate synthase (FAD)
VKHRVLDHGYTEHIESWGSDERIVEAARMSTAKGFMGWGPKCRTCGDSLDAPERPCPNASPGRELVDVGRGGHVFDAPGDEKLLRYLYENKHSTPFEMAGMTIEVQAPIMVFREWHRHRTQSYSELSARYTPMPDVNYVPTVDRLLLFADGTNKQAGTIKGAETLTLESALEWLAALADVYEHAERVYQDGLKRGVPKELARLPVPVGRFSRMRASANLRNWLGFLTLRSAPNAQWEIRKYAEQVGTYIAQAFPRTWQLFSERRSA